jgi:hypothetical protein
MMRQHHLVVVCFLLLSLSAMCLAVRPAAREGAAATNTPVAAWTIMLYVAADCDLEACQVDNVESMLDVGSGPDVHVVLLFDRSRKGEGDRPDADLAAEPSGATRGSRAGSSGGAAAGDDDPAYTNRPLANLGNWSGAKLLYVQRGWIRQIADWGPVNMGDPAVLKRFIDTATRQYPARRYALILNDHGLGWSGVCHDETHDDILTTPELRAALKQTTRRIGPLELLGFDACLMANFEVFQSLGPFARVLVASEELEPGEGWNYVTLLGKLQRDPSATGLEVGQMIAETFQEYFEHSDDSALSAITLSVVQSERLPLIAQAIDRLAAALRRQLAAAPDAAWLKLARARLRTVEFGRPDSAEGAAHLDLVHLCELLAKEFPEGPVQEACIRLTAAVHDAVVRNVHSPENPNSHGLTIFFPATREVFEDAIDVAYKEIEFSREGAWFGWLDDYIGEAQRHPFHPLLRELRVSRSQLAVGGQLTVTSGLDGDSFNEAYLALAVGHGQDRRLLAEISTGPDENLQLNDTWNGRWYAIESGPQKVLCPVLNWREVRPREDHPAGKPPGGKQTGAKEPVAKEPGVKKSGDTTSADTRPSKRDATKEPKSDAAMEQGPRIAEIPAQLRHKGSGTWHDVSLVFEISGDLPWSRFVEAYSRGRHGARALSLNRGDELRLLRGTIDGGGVRKLLPVADQPLLSVTDPRELRIGYQALPPGVYQIGYLVSNLANAFEEEFVEVELGPTNQRGSALSQ